MKIGQYCQRKRCKHVELEQFLAGFRVARVCQRYLGFLVHPENDFSGFLDPKNLNKDTKFITPGQIQMELYRA